MVKDYYSISILLSMSKKMLTFDFVIEKGGGGKSAGAANTIFAIARKIEKDEKEGKPVKGKGLAIDFDPQATLTQHLLGEPYPVDEISEEDGTVTVAHPSMYHALIGPKKIEPLVINERIHLIPANKDLQKAEVELLGKANYQIRAARVLQFYDYCVIDTPGNTNMLTVLALAAADQVIVPVRTDINMVRALPDTIATIKDVQESGLNPRLLLWGILANQHEPIPLHNSEALQLLKKLYGNVLYHEISNKTTKYNDAIILKGDVSLLDKELGMFWDRIVESLLENEKRRGMQE